MMEPTQKPCFTFQGARSAGAGVGNAPNCGGLKLQHNTGETMAYPVLFMIQHLNQGGTEDHFHDLVTGIDHQRFEPHVIHFNNLDGYIALKLARNGGVRKTFIPVSRAYNLSGLAAVLAVRKYLRRHQIRALVTYHFVADFVGTLAAWGRRTPVISSRRDMGFTRTARQLKIGTLLDRGVSRYIAVSGAVGEAVGAQERIAPGKIETIYNGIDFGKLMAAACDPAAERQARGIGQDEFVIGCVANFGAIKNHLMLLDAFARLRAEQSGRRLRLLLAGDGPMREAIEARVGELGLGEAVMMVGFSREVAREFLVSDIMVLPSDTEGLSNSLIKAMAFEKPVVACRVGGNPEVVVEGETGLLVAPKQPEAFATAMGRLMGDAELCRRMGEEGRRRVREYFSIEAMIRSHEDLLTNLIEAGAGKSQGGKVASGIYQSLD